MIDEEMIEGIKVYLLLKFIAFVDWVLKPHGHCVTQVFGFRDGNDDK